MNLVQNTFNKVIAGYFYPECKDSSRASSNYMCVALSIAEQEDVITHDEFLEARKAIQAYLCGSPTLKASLLINKLSCLGTNRLAIYCNWDNRPTLEK